MTNLLKETLKDMQCNGKYPADVDWVGSRNGKYGISFDEFAAIANREYDAGYGSAEVAMDLVVVGKDGWWLERHEYDGAESWWFREAPQPDYDQLPFNKVFCECYENTIEELMQDKNRWED